ncbi:MAG: HWE histidine kinase domain-containing protein [Erythrobacter sp.]
MNAQDFTLSNCDREPIHQLGQVQAFGALIAVNADWFVAHRSTNLESIFGPGRTLEAGERLGSLFAPAALEQLRSAAAALTMPDQVERRFGVDLFDDGVLFDCALHSSGAYTIIESEPHAAGDLNHQLGLLRPIMARLEQHGDIEAMAAEAARQLRHALQMDRVMVYRFREDLSGEVIAEAARDDLEKFHGLRYPKSDIPSQARKLYLRNRFRIIADVESEPVDIEPGISIDGEPLDLSMSTLRAVSPIHIEYLRNMGVGASLSISIVIGGKLWGLFACHHYGPRLLPYSQRTAAELFSEMFSLLLDRTLAAQVAERRELGREVHARLMRDIAAGTPLSSSLPLIEPVIQQIIPHDGVSIFMEDIYDARGAAPNEEEFRAILPSLNGAATSRLLASEAIAERLPRAERFAERAAGALIIPVSRSPRDYLVLWRKPLAQTVTWAGNPDKPVVSGPHGDRLTPRKSFEAWQETVEGRAEKWSQAELDMAESLRVTLLEIILRLTDEAVAERAKAQQQQELLIAELNHRVRNILNLIRGLINQSKGDAPDIETFVDIVGGRVSSLAAAHENITKGNWSHAPFSDLIATEANAYLGGKTDRLVVTGPEAMISPEAYTVMALVIHEMITNSAKYGSLSDQSGKLDIVVSRDDDDNFCVDWRETGGPPVKPPKRRGFGSTIIERSLPHELDGSAEIHYRLSGVEARFCIPARYVEWRARTGVPSAGASKKKKGDRLENLPESVLLVEDSMIIALDAEDCLKELGVGQVRIESSVAAALDALDKSSPALAILDYNLGKENSEPVAEKLRAVGTPFWLATGYGEMQSRVAELGAAGLLTKPYGKDELAQILADFGRE